jgi:hypothetical protein
MKLFVRSRRSYKSSLLGRPRGRCPWILGLPVLSGWSIVAGCYHHLVVRLPNGGDAIVDAVKLHDYALSQGHPRGRHKARVFLAALDLTAADTEELRSALLESARTGEAVSGKSDEFGTRYTVDFEMVHSTKRARIRGSWIARAGDSIPRLTSRYVL